MFSAQIFIFTVATISSLFSYVSAAVPDALSEAFDTTFVLTPTFGVTKVVDSETVASSGKNSHFQYL